MAEIEAELKLLDKLLGDTRARYHRRETPFLSAERLMELDREIRTFSRAPSPELEGEVRKLIDRLHALDPH